MTGRQQVDRAAADHSLSGKQSKVYYQGQIVLNPDIIGCRGVSGWRREINASHKLTCMVKVSTTSRPRARAFEMPPLSARSAAEPAAMGYSPPTPYLHRMVDHEWRCSSLD